jgi:hypothetical protein
MKKGDMMKRCPNCRRLKTDKFCTECGEDLRKLKHDKCECGALRYDSDNHCGKCGKKNLKK